MPGEGDRPRPHSGAQLAHDHALVVGIDGEPRHEGGAYARRYEPLDGAVVVRAEDDAQVDSMGAQLVLRLQGRPTLAEADEGEPGDRLGRRSVPGPGGGRVGLVLIDKARHARGMGAVILIAVAVVVALLGVLFGADSRDHRGLRSHWGLF